MKENIIVMTMTEGNVKGSDPFTAGRNLCGLQAQI